MSKKLTYKQFGERAILIEWEAKIDEEILTDITSFRDKIQNTLKDKIQDCIVGYHSLTIVYKDFINFSSEEKSLKKLYTEESVTRKSKSFLWQIPVCYDVQFGIDLEEISRQSKLSIEEIIQLHTKTIYTVYFIGFLPGFLYLGGLDEQLHFPRKSNPRLQVTKGSVAIGGSQTGVYPQESAGGWNIIGNTPINFFNIEKEHPCFAKSGDIIQFVSVSLDQYKAIQNQIEKGVYKLSKTVLND